MATHYSPKTVTDGLVLCLDAANPKSYPGSGNDIFDLSKDNNSATLNGTHTHSSEGIRLFNTNEDHLLNVSFIQVNNVIENITTVSLWYRLEGISAETRYVLDSRSGMSGGFIWSGSSTGSNWETGSLYLDGVDTGTISANKNLALTDNIGSWRNVILIANNPGNDDITLFARFSENEALDITFGAASIYNRALSPEEIQQNFQALRGRYGI